MGLGQKLLLWLLLPLLASPGAFADDPKREVLVKEVVLDSAVVDIVYLGKTHESVLVTTKMKRLYFSTDSGKSWTETTASVDKNDRAEIQVERVIVNPTDKSVAVMQTQRRLRSTSGVGGAQGRWYPYIYITEDSGLTWRRAWGKHHGMHNWISHPTERSWAVVSWWSGNCNADKVKKIEKSAEADEDAEEESKACVHRLMVTTDLGKNFLQLAEYVVQFSWGSTEAEQTNRVYFTAYRKKSGDQGKLSTWTNEVDFNHIDFFKSGRPKGNVVTDLKKGNKFLISGPYVLVARVKDEASQVVNLMVSKDGAKTFKAALLPSGMGELEEKWYTVLDTSEGAVILHINNDASGIKDTGRIFVSDAEGYKFSQSLVNNVRSAHGECEFDKVVSLTGVYLSNIVVPAVQSQDQGFDNSKSKAQDDMESEAAAGAELDTKHGRGGMLGKQMPKGSKEERTIRTVASFDKGGAWNYLKPPRVNSLGKTYDCSGKSAEECSLHLHGTTSWDFYAPFYSSETCVGIIMGTGNVGASLRFEPEETSTFLSRDGGLTWMEAHQGAFIYEFGDHGGIIVMADDLKMTSMVLFTWNEGQSWYDFKVSSVPFEVDNIITEPNVTATTFIMFGTRAGGEGVLYYLNFDALQFPACKGVWAADSVSSDYETWAPSDGSSAEPCMLGQQLTYTRRKRTSQCWNGEKFERPVRQKACACTQSDFMCDIGFTRSVGATECVFGGLEMMPQSMLPSACDGTFQVSAYRKVAGDSCENGWSPTPSDVPCPSKPMDTSNFKYIVGVLVVAGVLWMLRGYGGKGVPSFEMSAPKSMCADCSPMMVVQMPLLLLAWLYERFCVTNRGFDSNPGLKYGSVKGDDFDFDAGFDGDGGTSLTDFIAEADYDDTPKVYDGAAADRSSGHDRGGYVSAGLSEARSSVPKLAGPPGGGPQIFDLGGGDDADLL